MRRLIDMPEESGEPDLPTPDRAAAVSGTGEHATGEENHGDTGSPGGVAGPSPSSANPPPGQVGTVFSAARLRRGHVVGVAAVLLIAVLGAGVLMLRHRPVTQALPSLTPQPGLVAASSSQEVPPGAVPESPVASARGPTPGATGVAGIGPSVLIVHVAGKVRRPGVVELQPGARVIDALEACGGARRGVDLSTLNLARPVSDGEQILVGVDLPAAALAQPTQTGGQLPGSATPAVQVDLNSATLEQLETLPGIGPVLAQRILEARDERGGFRSVEELLEVSGIAERRYAELSERVVVR